METTVPVTVVPSKVNTTDRRARHLTRDLFYYLGFLTLLAGLVLAIISVVKDDLTKMSVSLVDSSPYNQYCGWADTHYYTDNSPGDVQISPFSYKSLCKRSEKGCKMEQIGKAWYSLLIIGIAFAGLALISFIFDYTLPLTWVMIVLFDFLFFACMLAAVLTWGITQPCDRGCRKLEFWTADIVSCKAKFGISWILAVIAGGLGLLSLLCALISRAFRKRY